MPYRSNRELPDGVKNALPEHAQAIFRNAFNSVSARGADEQSAMQQAWGAVKNAGYEKNNKTGNWKRVRKSIDPALELVMNSFDPELLDRFLKSDEGRQVIFEIVKGEPGQTTKPAEAAEASKPAGQIEVSSSHMKVAKVDNEQCLVFGFFSINKVGDNLVEDLQGDMIETDTLEKAAYDFVLNARVAGEVHVRKNVGRLVESVMLTYEKQDTISKCLQAMGIKAELSLGCEGWFGGFRVDDDDVWASVKAGDYPAFSIGGSGSRLPVNE